MSDLLSVVFYIATFSVSGLLFSQYKSKRKIIRIAGVSLSVLIPAIVAGLRYNVGTDYDNYNNMFTALRSIKLSEVHLHFQNIEKGFIFISKLLVIIFDNKVVFGIWALIILAILVLTLLRQYSQFDLTLCYVLFLFLTFSDSFNILRQCIAAVIVFYGFKYIFDNKPIRFLVIIVISSTIHFSALFAIPLWFLWNHKKTIIINYKKLGFVLMAACVAVVVWRPVLRFAMSIGIPFVDKYASYLSDRESSNRSFFVMLATLIVVLFTVRFLKCIDERTKFFIVAYAIGVIIESIGFYMPFAKRANLYYTIPLPMILSILPQSFTKNSRIIVKVCIVLYVIVQFIITAYILKQADLIPYRWK